jgi:hypothetical protein
MLSTYDWVKAHSAKDRKGVVDDGRRHDLPFSI